MVQLMKSLFYVRDAKEDHMKRVWTAAMYNVLSWLPFLVVHFHAGDGNLQDVEQHLEMGKMFLSQGRVADALTHYHAAIDADPNNYLTYFRRATVYLAMGKSKSALQDLDKVLEMRSDFTAARAQRGHVHLKQGSLDDALIDFERALVAQPDNIEAIKGLQTIQPLRQDIDTGYSFYEAGQYQHAVDFFSKAIEACPWSIYLRQSRGYCREELGDYYGAIQDYAFSAKLKPDNTDAYYKISRLYYEMGEAERALEEIRECLKLDPEHKTCFPHYKKVKKLVKQLEMVEQLIKEERYDECVGKAEAALKTENHVHSFIIHAKSRICLCYSKAKNGKMAVETCSEVLKLDENNVDALINRAEGHIANEEYDQGIQDYQAAKGLEDSQKVNEGLHRAQKLLKQSKKRDYYKILGVRRNARKPEILKAYRKAAVKWHPDKYEGDDKKKAEQKFIDIAAAKEVLTDPEKRSKYDSGEDPLDPESQQGHNPFGQGGFPFGGQGFQFKFHFN